MVWISTWFFASSASNQARTSCTTFRQQAEKISPNDLAVFDDEAVPNRWSRRVHTLERIADRIPVINRFPAYAEYTNENKHRHLFQVRCGVIRSWFWDGRLVPCSDEGTSPAFMGALSCNERTEV